MEFKGKTIIHFKYGPGKVTAFYPDNMILWISFNDQSPKMYEVPKDFDEGILSTDDAEIIQYIADYKNSIRYRLHVRRIIHQSSPNKDLMKFFRESCEILDDLGIKYGNVTDVRIVDYNPAYFGRCIHISKDEKQIEICRDTLRDETLDGDVYQLILHELIHTCNGGIRHNKKFREYASIIERFYGYTINKNGRDHFYEPIVLKPKK